MKKLTLILVVIFLGLNGSQAEDRLPLKNKSSFQLESNAHNPFWPIGFKPTASLARAGNTSGLDIPLSAFLLTSVTLDQGAHFAIINGKSMKEGQQFTLQAGSQTYQLMLRTIEDGRVILTCQDREIVVPLRRK